MSHGGGGQKSDKKVSRIIWIAPKRKIVKLLIDRRTSLNVFVFISNWFLFPKIDNIVKWAYVLKCKEDWISFSKA